MANQFFVYNGLTPPQPYSPPVSVQTSSSPPVLVPNVFYPVYNMPTKPTTPPQIVSPQGFAVPSTRPPPQPIPQPYQIPTHEAAPTRSVPEIPCVFELTLDEIKEESKKLRERRSAFHNGTIFFSAGGEKPPHAPRTIQPTPDSNAAPQPPMFQNVNFTNSQTKL